MLLIGITLIYRPRLGIQPVCLPRDLYTNTSKNTYDGDNIVGSNITKLNTDQMLVF